MNDPDLQQQFEDLSLPFDQWTHRAHIRMAFCYLQQHKFEDAVDRARKCIKAYNAHNNLPNGPTTGYNETTTVAFMRLIDSTMKAYGDAMPTPDSESFCDMHPHLLHRQVLRLFYSPKHRMHPDAKFKFVEPDLAPFPNVSNLGK